MKKGLFITFEGIDKSGKSTQIKKLNKYFKCKKIKTIVTRDPGGTDISEAIRSIVLDNRYKEMSKKTELLLYISSRAQLMNELILPAIKNSKTVICDRFTDSTLVYQGYGRGLDLDILKNLNKFVCNENEPDITFLLDIDIDTFNKRFFSKSNKKDRIENESNKFYKKLIFGYNELVRVNKDRIKKIDGRRSVNSINDEIIAEVENLLRSC